MTSETASTPASAPAAPEVAAMPVPLVNRPVKTQNDALQLMWGFLNMAQQKGAYSIEESAKIWECISMFRVTAPTTTEEKA